MNRGLQRARIYARWVADHEGREVPFLPPSHRRDTSRCTFRWCLELLGLECRRWRQRACQGDKSKPILGDERVMTILWVLDAWNRQVVLAGHV